MRGLGSPAGAAAGLVLDAIAGDPPDSWHPVAWFGRAMERVERSTWADRRLAGGRHALLGIGTGVVAGRLLGSTTAATAIAAGGRTLDRTAASVAAAVAAEDLDAARARLPALVGRDSSALDEKGICRAVIESVAENTVDAVVAPALWAAAAGAPGVLVHRAVNTLDAMVGHRTPRHERFGWASARLDDAAGWLPARVTAGLVVCARPARRREVLDAVARQAPAHPSPNAGVAEAAFAGALGVRLGGPVGYAGRIVDLPELGDGPRPGLPDVERARRLARDVRAALVVGLLGLALALRSERAR